MKSVRIKGPGIDKAIGVSDSDVCVTHDPDTDIQLMIDNEKLMRQRDRLREALEYLESCEKMSAYGEVVVRDALSATELLDG